MKQEIFRKKVIPLFTMSIIVTAIGAFFGLAFYSALQNTLVLIGLAIFEVILIILLYTKFRENIPILYLFTFVSGILLAPILGLAIAVEPMLIAEAFAITSIVFVSLSAYAYTTKKDFSFLGGILFVLLILAIILSLGQFFIHSYAFNLGVDIFVALLFAVFVLYDMSTILRHYSDKDYIPATVSLYIDFINLFVRILSILIRTRGED